MPIISSCPINPPSKQDESQEALRNVEKITDSEPASGEELLESEELKRQLREAKSASSQEQKPTK